MKKISVKRRVGSGILNALMYIAAGLTCMLLLGLIIYIFYRGLSHVSWELISSEPSFLRDTIGILPNILNTLYIILMTLIIVLPLGVGAAIYLTEYAKNKKLVKVIEFATETLAGIPSIIYGLVGMLFFVQFCSLGTSLLAGALTLVIVTLPTIIRTTQESLKTVPQSYREGSLALGAGKWHMIRTVVLPSSIDGIVTGCILAIGRIVGESAALFFTAGMANNIMNLAEAVQPGHAGSTLTIALYMYAKERGEFDIAFAIASILLILTFIINISAKLAAKKLKRQKEEK
jgi:phosphate transport system permease protein